MGEVKQEISPKSKPHLSQQDGLQETELLAQQGIPSTLGNQIISRIGNTPSQKVHADMLNRAPATNKQLLLQLQRQYGNSYVQQVVQQAQQQDRPKIQAKLTIGEPGDKYEQEADRVAQQVVRQINAPVPSGQSEAVQRQMPEEKEEELAQIKAEADSLQRQTPEEKDEDVFQMKPMVQRQADAGMAATPDLEASINQARGGGQPLADTIREPMEHAFRADFSGVKVHTGAQSDQLNKSIHAKAFTTGQDVFFRLGEYDPGSRGGQELIAHELTHVVQQNVGVVQKTPMITSEAEGKSDQFSSCRYQDSGVLQLARNGTKTLKYRSFNRKRRQGGVRKMKSKQVNLNRGRVLHVRHIIPHSDLQQWMETARMAGNDLSTPGRMRRQIYTLLVYFGDATNAQLWRNTYIGYEGRNTNQSMLQDAQARVGVENIWRAIEWHQGNIFLGQGGINTAIQNRFDAGSGAVSLHGQAYIDGLHTIWYNANTLLGLAPTPIQDTRIYSVWLNSYIIVRAASHNNSRPMLAALGLIHRTDYVRID